MTSEIVNDNVTCCTLPPIYHEYTPKGEYKPYGGHDKAYIVGPTGTGKALIIVYDIFGFFPQTIQGADILAETLQARVVMPDFFGDKRWPIEGIPPRSKEEGEALQLFFKTEANPDSIVPKVTPVARELQKEGATKIGALGYCWGAKITMICGGIKEDWVTSVAGIHPSLLNDADIEALKVPVALYPSKDENEDDSKRFSAIISKSKKNDYKVYPTMRHGWAAARGDLVDPEGLKQYKDVYARTAGFFYRTFEN